MKVAVLSDIHGNSVALKAVLAEATRLNVEHYLVLGDIVGYYYRPDEALALLSGLSTTMIRGNHESMLAEARGNSEAAERIRSKYGAGIDVALQKLTSGEVDRLVTLPQTATIQLDGISLRLCHGSPWNADEYVYPDAAPEILEKCAHVSADFLLMGHTHYPFAYAGGSVTVLNAGSVGQPRDTGNLASWAILNTVNRSVVCKRTLFDVAPVIADAQRHDPAIPYLAEVLKR